MNALRLSTALILLSTFASLAQTPDKEPPRREDERREGDRRGPGSGPGGPSGMMRPPMGFDKLTEDERRQLREAFSKAWSSPEVAAARDEALKANENARRVLHDVMKKSDPKIAAILDKIKPPYPVDDRGFPQLPPPDSPDFAKVATERMRAEMMSVAKPGKHEDSRRLHDRIMTLAPMKDAVTALDKATPQERIESFRRIRELYRKLVGEELGRLAKAREAGEAAKKAPEPKEQP